jgi:DNA topoisomerase-3
VRRQYVHGKRQDGHFSGWKAYQVQEQEQKEKSLPGLTEGQKVEVSAVHVKEGKTSPPRPYSEDTLLSAMESAGAKDMPKMQNVAAFGTPATSAGTIEKVVSSGFAERKKAMKAVQLIPTPRRNSPHYRPARTAPVPALTAEWEHRLKLIGAAKPTPPRSWTGSPPCSKSWWNV